MELRYGSPRVFKTRWFERFVRKQNVRDPVLADAVRLAEKGQEDADLGCGVIKQRVARPGQGKSGGYRTIILFRRGKRAAFAYGFAKSDRANIDADEEKQFKEAARHVLRLIDKRTMRRFDDACLTPVQLLSPKQIRALREREHVSQTVFANYLNVTQPGEQMGAWRKAAFRSRAQALVSGREARHSGCRVTSGSRKRFCCYESSPKEPRECGEHR